MAVNRALLRAIERDPVPVADLRSDRGTVPLPELSRRETRSRIGLTGIGGCAFNAATVFRFGTIADVLHLSHGPVGCGHYAQATRRSIVGRTQGVDAFASLHLTSDFQESDVVFGGDRKLAGCLAEMDTLFPLARGMSVIAECPVGLIGDDIRAAARASEFRLGKPVVPLRCEGFRGSGDQLFADLERGWEEAGNRLGRPRTGSDRDVLLTCHDFDMGHGREVERLLTAIGLNVVARWPGRGSLIDAAREETARLNIIADQGAGRDRHALELEARAGVPWIAVDFLHPDAIDATLRRIAARFETEVGERAERLIATARPSVEATFARYRPRLTGKLVLSLSPLPRALPAAFHALGLRVGTVWQGWPDPDGNWVEPPEPRTHRYRGPFDPVVARAVRLARPDAVTGCGPDASYFRKIGVVPLDPMGGPDRLSTWGYEGFARFARDLDRLINAPWRGLVHMKCS